MCLAHGHNAVTLVRLEPAAPLSRVKHPTTEPLRSLVFYGDTAYTFIRIIGKPSSDKFNEKSQ